MKEMVSSRVGMADCIGLRQPFPVFFQFSGGPKIASLPSRGATPAAFSLPKNGFRLVSMTSLQNFAVRLFVFRSTCAASRRAIRRRKQSYEKCIVQEFCRDVKRAARSSDRAALCY